MRMERDRETGGLALHRHRHKGLSLDQCHHCLGEPGKTLRRRYSPLKDEIPALDL